MVTERISYPTAEVVVEAFEQYGVYIIDISFSVHCVAHAQTLIPAFLALFADVFEGIESVDR